jgi:hypothetical protein
VSLTYAQKLCCGAAKRAIAVRRRYKTDSARKSLIHKTFAECPFSGQASQALDFPGLAGLRGQCINKVIHKKRVNWYKSCENKDLARLSRLRMKTRH